MKRARSTQEEKLPRDNQSSNANLVLLFLLFAFFLFAWLYIDPYARYHAAAPAFFFGNDLFAQRISEPGGLVSYVGGFLAQLDYYPWLGALVFGLVAGTICLLSRMLLAIGGWDLGWAWTFPGFVLLALHAMYEPPVMELAFGLLLGMGALAGWLRWRAARWQLRLAIFSGLVLAVYYAAGLPVSLLFVVVGGLHEFFRSRDWRAGLGCWVWAMPAAGMLALGSVDLTIMKRDLGGAAPAAIVAILYGYFPVSLALAVFAGRHSQLRDPVADRGWPLNVAQAGLALLVLCIFTVSFSTEQRALARIQSEAEKENWEGVLAAAAPLNELPPAARLQINRALQKLGRLNCQLFSYPQRAGGAMLASLEDGLDVCLPLSDTLVEMGQVNLAEQYAHEALEVRGERPELLWRLAKINLVKERPQAAMVFLNRMSMVPFHRTRAEAWLNAIKHDWTADGIEEIGRLRALRPLSNMAEQHFSTEAVLRQLLQGNADNRMASDYLAAQLLLARNTEGVTELLASSRGNESSELPRHISEALLQHSLGNGVQRLELAQGSADPGMARRLERFEALIRSGANPARAREFSDTYWFYEVFGRSSRADQSK
jgi:hypothetical protein